MKRKSLFLLCILILAAFLRLYKLSDVPPGVNRDEASIGYTAYSLLQTGKDEYGRSFPLSFQSFGDWKLPLYIYTTVPFVKIFGLNELAVRLPSAIAGTLTVWLTYFLVLELFGKLEIRNLKLRVVALLSILLLAFSPWHIHLSRVESESNVAVLVIVGAVILFLKGINTKRSLLIALSLPLFALTYYAYHGNHVFTTLLLIGLGVMYHKKIPHTLVVIISSTISIALIVFILSQTLLGADKTKIAGISIFGDPNVIHENIELPRTRSANPTGLITRLRYNRVTYALVTVTRNYINSFSPKFLFIKGGGNAAHNIKNFGNLYLVELPFFYLGIFLLLFSAFSKNSPFAIRHSPLLFWWLLISPVAGMITKDAPHTNRMFAIFPLPPILIALGIIWFIHLLKKRIAIRYLAVLTILLAYSVNIAYYLNRYYVHFPVEEQNSWGIGYKQLSAIITSEKYRSKQIIIAHPEYSPYIFLLFYSKFDPATYQKTAVRYPPTTDAFVHVKAFDRFEFRDINWGKDLATRNTLLIDETTNIPPAFRTLPHSLEISSWTVIDTDQ